MMLLQILPSVIVMFGSASEAIASVTCKDPANPELEIASALYDLYTDPVYSNFSLNIDPCFRNRFQVPIESSHIGQYDTLRHCKHHRGNSDNQACVDGYLENQSKVNAVTGNTLCSWTNVLDIEDNRIPRVISIAQCSCLHCHKGICQSMYTYMPVLKKQCNDVTGTFVYRKYIYKVSTGCVCVQGIKVSKPDRHRRRHTLVMPE